jgi:thymidylate synthase (FAD)
MRVKFVSVTKAFVEEKDMTAEELLVYIARVSNPSNQLNTDTSDKLLAYLIKNKHWSPFDMVNMTVEVKTSKAIAIQILRHWSIKPQEFSQRYAEVTDIEPIHLRKAAASNRQSSEDRFDPLISQNYRDGKYTGQRASDVIQKYVDIGQLLYKELLQLGVAKECARMILPMATSTTMYLNGSVRSWIHYLQQRLDQHAQLEHREVAKEIKNIFQQNFPNIIKALEL